MLCDKSINHGQIIELTMVIGNSYSTDFVLQIIHIIMLIIYIIVLIMYITMLTIYIIILIIYIIILVICIMHKCV